MTKRIDPQTLTPVNVIEPKTKSKALVPVNLPAPEKVGGREPDYAALTLLMTTRRPHKSKSEKEIIRELIWPLGVELDGCGNLYKRIGDAPVLWSCHTDSVHWKDGKQGVRIEDGKIVLASGSKSNCLGADDAAGVWLMREMILANRPGLYIFHRGEERGGIGSSYIRDKTPELLKGIKWAIALDRRGFKDVITHQAWKRCCSQEFAEALAAKLGHDYRPDDGGLFTDTANYVTLVPECTNLSVGYHSEHSKSENLDIPHLLMLRKQLLALDVSDLPAVRDPDKVEWKYSNYEGWRGTGTKGGKWEDDYYQNWDDDGGGSGQSHWWDWKKNKKKHHKSKGTYSPWRPEKGGVKGKGGIIFPHEYGMSMGGKTGGADKYRAADEISLPNLLKTVKHNPHTIVEILMGLGMNRQEILDKIYNKGGILYYD